MSDIPRTDSKEFPVDCPGMLDPVYHVSADFARELERELNRLREQLEDVQQQRDTWRARALDEVEP